jgi:hypothetical protein
MSIFVDNDETRSWKAYLQTLTPPAQPVRLPTGDDFLSTLRYLGVPEDDQETVIAMAPVPDTDPEIWWYLERAVWSLVSKMGSIEQPPRFAPLRDVNDPKHRFFYVHVFVAALPYVQRYFHTRGIPADIAQATLADLGRNIQVHHKRENIGGLGVMWWLMLHFRGAIYQLGRLQFERVRLSEQMVNAMRDAGCKVSDDEHALSIHIPDFIGPMTDDACEDSIRQAREFFKRFFPDEPVRYGVCHSWLLDPQLKAYLRPESNIIKFQDRFVLGPAGDDNSNESVLRFVFGPILEELDAYPQRSSLERAVIANIKAGKAWQFRSGWLEL